MVVPCSQLQAQVLNNSPIPLDSAISLLYQKLTMEQWIVQWYVSVV